MKYRLFPLKCGLAFLLALSSTQAQWRTESFALAEGWSAIHLPIDTEARPITDLLAEHSVVQEIWQWNPSGLDAVIVNDPSSPVAGPEWRYWKRHDLVNSTLNHLAPNRSYLVNCSEALTLSLKGRVVSPAVQWRTDGLNLLGFRTSQAAPPTAESFLAPTQLLEASTEMYGYVGGPLAEATNPQLHQAKFTPMTRNRAFWIRTSRYADYDGPIRVRTALGTSLDFGAELPTQRLIIANRTNREVTVTLTPQTSEAAPGSDIPPTAVPLLRQVIDETTGERSYVAFGVSHQVTLSAAETLGLTIAVNRTTLAGPVGRESASLLQVTDGEGSMEVYLPVKATAASLAGLWLGQAEITHVQNQLQTGSNTIQPVADYFPLSLILHIDASGKGTLLSQAYFGVVAEGDDGVPVLGVSSEESRLLPEYLGEASRFTSTHFPLNTALALDGNVDFPDTFNTSLGTLPISGVYAKRLTISHDSPANPFLHAFHPDHDNLDERFENALPNGIETHTILRDLSLLFHEAAPEGLNDPSWGTSLLTGHYFESLSGLHKNTIETAGHFALRRVAADVSLHLP